MYYARLTPKALSRRSAKLLGWTFPWGKARITSSPAEKIANLKASANADRIWSGRTIFMGGNLEKSNKQIIFTWTAFGSDEHFIKFRILLNWLHPSNKIHRPQRVFNPFIDTTSSFSIAVAYWSWRIIFCNLTKIVKFTSGSKHSILLWFSLCVYLQNFICKFTRLEAFKAF